MLALLLLTALVFAGADSAAQVADLLPDLIIDPERSFGTRIDTSTLPGRELLRVDTSTANVGLGRLEIRASAIVSETQREVVQRVYGSDGTWWQRPAGTFTFHAAHDHIHFDDWTRFRLREVTEDGDVGDVVVEGGKTSFCLLDLYVYDPKNPSFRLPGFYSTCGDQVQGITPGWGDIYSLALSDQWIDVTGVPDDLYWLEMEVDPEDRVIEADETNNSSRFLIAMFRNVPVEPDRYEENDSSTDVGARPEGGVDSPNLGLLEAPLEIERLSMDDRFDYFKFRTDQTGEAGDFVRIESLHVSGDLDLILLGADGIPIDGSVTSRNVEQVSLEGLPPGDYFALVLAMRGEVPEYSLTINPSGDDPATIEVLRPEAPGLWVERALETVPVEWIASDPEGEVTRVSLFAARERVFDKRTLPLPGYQDLAGEGGGANVNTADMDLGRWFLYAQVSDGGAVSGDWAPGSFTLYVKGDVDFDGELTLRDYIAAIRAQNRGDPDPRWLAVADMNDDGRFDRRDLALLRQEAVEWLRRRHGRGPQHGDGHGS